MKAMWNNQELLVVFKSGASFDYETGLPIITVMPEWQEASTAHPVQRQLLVIIKRGEGHGYVAYCPEVKGAMTQGETIDEIMENMADAITLMLEARGQYEPFVMRYQLSTDDNV